MWRSEALLLQLYRGPEYDICPICHDTVRHPNTRSLDVWHKCNQDVQIHPGCLKKWLIHHDTCPLCRDIIQSRIRIDFTYELERNYDEHSNKGGFYYKFPVGWTQYDEEADYEDDDKLNLRGPTANKQEMITFLHEFVKRHKTAKVALTTLEIEADGEKMSIS